jgi:protease-4
MSEMHDPLPPAPPGYPGPAPVPPPRPPVRYPPPPRVSLLQVTLGVVFALIFVASVGFNLILLVAAWSLRDLEIPLRERRYAGSSSAKDKIAVVQIDGAIMEGLLSYAEKQIDEAGKDDRVKAVVVRINSPGGSITASDGLHKRLSDLRDGNPDRKWKAKPLVVSMGSLAASGGYYIAMPAKHVVAERTTITGSIGVYAALPNVTDLADKWGVKLEVIKAGKMKDSGSMFKQMTPEERQVWENLVEHAYHQFLAVVEEGRPQLKGQLQKEFVVQGEDKQPVTRSRADGGIFTAEKAHELGLVDQIGYLEDALKEAKKLAGLGDSYKVITYDRPNTLRDTLLGAQAAAPRWQLDPGQLAQGLTPRLWYLGPHCDLTALLTAAGR